MLDLVGQLSGLAYAARLCGTAGPSRYCESSTIPHVTAAYLAACTLSGALCTVGVMPAEALSLDGQLVPTELWRLLTSFFSCDGKLGACFALQLWFFSMYSSLLERRHYMGRELRYVLTLAAGGALILASCAVVGTYATLTLSHALCFYVIGLWSRSVRISGQTMHDRTALDGCSGSNLATADRFCCSRSATPAAGITDAALAPAFPCYRCWSPLLLLWPSPKRLLSLRLLPPFQPLRNNVRETCAASYARRSRIGSTDSSLSGAAAARAAVTVVAECVAPSCHGAYWAHACHSPGQSPPCTTPLAWGRRSYTK